MPAVYGVGGNMSRLNSVRLNSMRLNSMRLNSMRLNSILCVLCIVALPGMLGGCAGVLVVGGLAGAAGGGYAAAQERGVGGAAGDFELQTNIEGAFVDAGPGLQEGITTSVFQGRVLLTGHVATPDMKARAAQVASRIAGVRALYDEVEVTPPGSTWDGAKDSWITARLRSEMMLDPDVRSGNYTIDTSNGSVYLIGSARSPAELELATRIARYIPGVKRVVSYVELRTGAPIAERPPGSGPAPAPVSSGGGNGLGMAPRSAPIEVQKL
jgi:osmotically-inducible protein OsmY